MRIQHLPRDPSLAPGDQDEREVSVDYPLPVVIEPGTQGEGNFVAYRIQDVDAVGTTFFMAVDLSDTTNYPHTVGTGTHIDWLATYLQLDKNNQGAGTARVGVITRIDGTNADVSFFAGTSFTNGSGTGGTSIRDRAYPQPLSTRVESGSTPNIVNGGATFAGLNTGATVPSQFGNVTPAVGDIVMVMENTNGAFDFVFSGFYIEQVD